MKRNRDSQAHDNERHALLHASCKAYKQQCALRKRFGKWWVSILGPLSDKTSCPKEAYNAWALECLSGQGQAETDGTTEAKTEQDIKPETPALWGALMEWAVRVCPVRWQFCQSTEEGLANLTRYEKACAVWMHGPDLVSFTAAVERIRKAAYATSIDASPPTPSASSHESMADRIARMIKRDLHPFAVRAPRMRAHHQRVFVVSWYCCCICCVCAMYVRCVVSLLVAMHLQANMKHFLARQRCSDPRSTNLGRK